MPSFLLESELIPPASHAAAAERAASPQTLNDGMQKPTSAPDDGMRKPNSAGTERSTPGSRSKGSKERESATKPGAQSRISSVGILYKTPPAYRASATTAEAPMSATGGFSNTTGVSISATGGFSNAGERVASADSNRSTVNRTLNYKGVRILNMPEKDSKNNRPDLFMDPIPRSVKIKEAFGPTGVKAPTAPHNWTLRKPCARGSQPKDQPRTVTRTAHYRDPKGGAAQLHKRRETVSNMQVAALQRQIPLSEVLQTITEDGARLHHTQLLFDMNSFHNEQDPRAVLMRGTLAGEEETRRATLQWFNYIPSDFIGRIFGEEVFSASTWLNRYPKLLNNDKTTFSEMGTLLPKDILTWSDKTRLFHIFMKYVNRCRPIKLEVDADKLRASESYKYSSDRFVPESFEDYNGEKVKILQADFFKFLTDAKLVIFSETDIEEVTTTGFSREGRARQSEVIAAQIATKKEMWKNPEAARADLSPNIPIDHAEEIIRKTTIGSPNVKLLPKSQQNICHMPDEEILASAVTLGNPPPNVVDVLQKTEEAAERNKKRNVLKLLQKERAAQEAAGAPTEDIDIDKLIAQAEINAKAEEAKLNLSLGVLLDGIEAERSSLQDSNSRLTQMSGQHGMPGQQGQGPGPSPTASERTSFADVAENLNPGFPENANPQTQVTDMKVSSDMTASIEAEPGMFSGKDLAKAKGSHGVTLSQGFDGLGATGITGGSAGRATVLEDDDAAAMKSPEIDTTDDLGIKNILKDIRTSIAYVDKDELKRKMRGSVRASKAAGNRKSISPGGCQSIQIQRKAKSMHDTATNQTDLKSDFKKPSDEDCDTRPQVAVQRVSTFSEGMQNAKSSTTPDMFRSISFQDGSKSELPPSRQSGPSKGLMVADNASRVEEMMIQMGMLQPRSEYVAPKETSQRVIVSPKQQGNGISLKAIRDEISDEDLEVRVGPSRAHQGEPGLKWIARQTARKFARLENSISPDTSPGSSSPYGYVSAAESVDSYSGAGACSPAPVNCRSASQPSVAETRNSAARASSIGRQSTPVGQSASLSDRLPSKQKIYSQGPVGTVERLDEWAAKPSQKRSIQAGQLRTSRALRTHLGATKRSSARDSFNFDASRSMGINRTFAGPAAGELDEDLVIDKAKAVRPHLRYAKLPDFIRNIGINAHLLQTKFGGYFFAHFCYVVAKLAEIFYGDLRVEDQRYFLFERHIAAAEKAMKNEEEREKDYQNELNAFMLQLSFQYAVKDGITWKHLDATVRATLFPPKPKRPNLKKTAPSIHVVEPEPVKIETFDPKLAAAQMEIKTVPIAPEKKAPKPHDPERGLKRKLAPSRDETANFEKPMDPIATLLQGGFGGLSPMLSPQTTTAGKDPHSALAAVGTIGTDSTTVGQPPRTLGVPHKTNAVGHAHTRQPHPPQKGHPPAGGRRTSQPRAEGPRLSLMTSTKLQSIPNGVGQENLYFNILTGGASTEQEKKALALKKACIEILMKHYRLVRRKVGTVFKIAVRNPMDSEDPLHAANNLDAAAIKDLDSSAEVSISRRTTQNDDEGKKGEGKDGKDLRKAACTFEKHLNELEKKTSKELERQKSKEPGKQNSQNLEKQNSKAIEVEKVPRGVKSSEDADKQATEEEKKEPQKEGEHGKDPQKDAKESGSERIDKREAEKEADRNPEEEKPITKCEKDALRGAQLKGERDKKDTKKKGEESSSSIGTQEGGDRKAGPSRKYSTFGLETKDLNYIRNLPFLEILDSVTDDHNVRRNFVYLMLADYLANRKTLDTEGKTFTTNSSGDGLKKKGNEMADMLAVPEGGPPSRKPSKDSSSMRSPLKYPAESLFSPSNNPFRAPSRTPSKDPRSPQSGPPGKDKSTVSQAPPEVRDGAAFEVKLAIQKQVDVRKILEYMQKRGAPAWLRRVNASMVEPEVLLLIEEFQVVLYMLFSKYSQLHKANINQDDEAKHPVTGARNRLHPKFNSSRKQANGKAKGGQVAVGRTTSYQDGDDRITGVKKARTDRSSVNQFSSMAIGAGFRRGNIAEFADRSPESGSPAKQGKKQDQQKAMDQSPHRKLSARDEGGIDRIHSAGTSVSRSSSIIGGNMPGKKNSTIATQRSPSFAGSVSSGLSGNSGSPGSPGLLAVTKRQTQTRMSRRNLGDDPLAKKKRLKSRTGSIKRKKSAQGPDPGAVENKEEAAKKAEQDEKAEDDAAAARPQLITEEQEEAKDEPKKAEEEGRAKFEENEKIRRAYGMGHYAKKKKYGEVLTDQFRAYIRDAEKNIDLDALVAEREVDALANDVGWMVSQFGVTHKEIPETRTIVPKPPDLSKSGGRSKSFRATKTGLTFDGMEVNVDKAHGLVIAPPAQAELPSAHDFHGLKPPGSKEVPLPQIGGGKLGGGGLGGGLLGGGGGMKGGAGFGGGLLGAGGGLLGGGSGGAGLLGLGGVLGGEPPGGGDGSSAPSPCPETNRDGILSEFDSKGSPSSYAPNTDAAETSGYSPSSQYTHAEGAINIAAPDEEPRPAKKKEKKQPYGNGFTASIHVIESDPSEKKQKKERKSKKAAREKTVAWDKDFSPKDAGLDVGKTGSLTFDTSFGTKNSSPVGDKDDYKPLMKGRKSMPAPAIGISGSMMMGKMQTMPIMETGGKRGSDIANAIYTKTSPFLKDLKDSSPKESTPQDDKSASKDGSGTPKSGENRDSVEGDGTTKGEDRENKDGAKTEVDNKEKEYSKSLKEVVETEKFDSAMMKNTSASTPLGPGGLGKHSVDSRKVDVAVAKADFLKDLCGIPVPKAKPKVQTFEEKNLDDLDNKTIEVLYDSMIEKQLKAAVTAKVQPEVPAITNTGGVPGTVAITVQPASPVNIASAGFVSVKTASPGVEVAVKSEPPKFLVSLTSFFAFLQKFELAPQVFHETEVEFHYHMLLDEQKFRNAVPSSENPRVSRSNSTLGTSMGLGSHCLGKSPSVGLEWAMDFPGWIELLLRLTFCYCESQGNHVQRTTTAETKVVIMLTWLRRKSIELGLLTQSDWDLTRKRPRENVKEFTLMQHLL